MPQCSRPFPKKKVRWSTLIIERRTVRSQIRGGLEEADQQTVKRKRFTGSVDDLRQPRQAHNTPTKNAVCMSAEENLICPPTATVGQLKSERPRGPTSERDVAMTCAKSEVPAVIHQVNLKTV